MLDRTDRQILRTLQMEGRISNVQLAERVGISPSPTLERVRKLEREGVIRGYTALVEPAKVDIGIFAWVQVQLESHRDRPIDQFVCEVSDLEKVLECHHITGEFDYLIKVAAHDIADYEDFVLHHLTRLPGVAKINTSIVLSTVKQSTAVPIAENGSA